MKRIIKILTVVIFLFIVTTTQSFSFDSLVVKKYYKKGESPVGSFGVYSMLLDSKGRLWVSSHNYFGYFGVDGEFVNFLNKTDTLFRSDFGNVPQNFFNRMYEDQYGNIICQNSQGIGIFDGKNWQIINSEDCYRVKYAALNVFPDENALYVICSDEIIRFPYDIQTNKYIPSCNVQDSNRFRFPEIEMYALTGTYFSQGSAIILNVYNKNTGGWVVFRCNMPNNEWTEVLTKVDDGFVFKNYGEHPNGNNVVKYVSFPFPWTIGVYYCANIKDTTIINQKGDKYGMRPAILVWSGEWAREYVCMLEPLRDPFVGVQSAVFLDNYELLFFCNGDLFFFSEALGFRRIPPFVENLDPRGYMIRTDTNEIWIANNNGNLYVCDLYAMIATSEQVPTSVTTSWGSIENIESKRIPNLWFRSLYPNPVTRGTVTANIMCYLPSVRDIELGLYDFMGQNVLDLTNQFEYEPATATIHISFEVPKTLPKGSYFLVVRNGEETRTRGIVIISD